VSGYKISAVAAWTGFSAPTLRYYERIGLIPAPERTAGGYRSYDDEDLRVLGFVSRAKRLGLTLDEVRTLAAAWRSQDCRTTREQLLALVGDKFAQARHLIADLIRFRVQLDQVHATLSEAPVPKRCGPDCGCEIDVSRVELDVSRELNLVSLKPASRRAERPGA